MTTLHIINRPDIELAHLISEGDGIILIENGVYLSTVVNLPHLSPTLSVPVYAVQADVAARSMILDVSTTLVDYIGFVELCEQYDKVVTW